MEYEGSRQDVKGTYKEYGRTGLDYYELLAKHDQQSPPNILQKGVRALNKLSWQVYDFLYNAANMIPVVAWFTEGERVKNYKVVDKASRSWIGRAVSSVFVGVDIDKLDQIAKQELQARKEAEFKAWKAIENNDGVSIEQERGIGPETGAIKPGVTPPTPKGRIRTV
jgi:hypothetical protein